MESSETTTQVPFTYKYRVRDLAYAAGIIDGEGCIGGWEGRRANRTDAFVYVKVTNSNRELIDWFVKLFGGRVVQKSITNTRWKNSWDWICSAEHITPMLHLLIPFLKLKQPQAYLAMAIRHGIEVKADREGLVTQIIKLKGMNQRGR